MLASFPASMLNQKPSDLGILNQFKLDPSRSRPIKQTNSARPSQTVQITTRPKCASKERDYSAHIKAWPLCYSSAPVHPQCTRPERPLIDSSSLRRMASNHW